MLSQYHAQTRRARLKFFHICLYRQAGHVLDLNISGNWAENTRIQMCGSILWSVNAVHEKHKITI